jgi:hypothetical protein
MSFSFPTSPSTNDLYSFGNKTWKYNGTGWVLVTNLDVAQTAWNKANLANVQANTGTVLAQGAFDNSNTKFSSSGGTINGSVDITQNLSVTGNLTVLGSSTSINTSSFTVQDTLLLLGLGNYTSDLLDIGFVSHYNDGTNAHTGIIRDASEKQWMFFEDYTPEVSPNNNIIITDPSFRYSNLRVRDVTGNLVANTVHVNGYNLFDYTTNSFTHANGAYDQANSAANYANSAFDYANSAFEHANSAYTTANNALANTTGTFGGDLTISGNLVVTGANVALGNVGNVHIYGGNTGQILVTTSPGNLSFIDLPTTNTTTYLANTVSLTNGVYVSGNLYSIQVLNDGDAYQLTDGTNTGPAWIFTTTFDNVIAFNRIVANIDYTPNSGHIVYFQLWNYLTSTWDNLGSYSGANGYSQYALEVLGYTSYISGGTVQLRLYHSNTGNASHLSKIDYLALQLSAQGSQGPRGATGAQGSVGSGVASGGTVGQILIKNSSTNYDTSWSNNLINAYNGANSAGSYANSAYTQANTATNDAAGASLYANGAFIQANAAYAAANNVAPQIEPAFAKANAAYESQNTTGTYANSAYIQANTATNNAAGASLYANGAFIQSNASYGQANSAASYANAAFLQANASYGQANSAASYANAAFLQANAVYQYANTLSPEDNVARYTANSAALYANGAFLQANAAFGVANNALPKTGGTLSGSLTVNGDLIINGTTTTVNTTTVSTTDSLIKLANNNTTSDTLDIGFYGVAYTNGQITYQGLARQAGSNNFLLFKGLTQDPSGNSLAAGSATAANVGTLIANVSGYSITSNGVDLFLYTTNAYTQANTGVNNAAGASLYANGAFLRANTPDAIANSAALYANGAFIQANAAFLQANTPPAIANSAALYANGAFIQANAAFLQANTPSGTANSAALYANGAFLQANAAFTKANNALANTTGTFNGSLSVTGTLTSLQSSGDEGGQIDLLKAATNTTLVTGVSIDVFQNRVRIFETGGTNRGVYMDLANNAGTNVGTDLLSFTSAATYANGAFLQANASFTTANNALPKAGGQLTGPVSSSNPIIASALTSNTTISLNGVGFDVSNTFTTASTAQVSVDSFATATYRSSRYFVQMTSGSSYHIIELFLVHDGTTVYLSQYGEVFTGSSLGTFDASITTGTLNLLFTATNAITTVKLIRRSIVV